MKLIYLKSALKCDYFDVVIGFKIPFFRVLITIEPGRSLLQFVTTNCLTMPNTEISEISLRLKQHLFNSNAMPVLLYAEETWHLNQEQERRVLTFRNSCLYRIFNIYCLNKMTNQSICEMTQQPLITDIIRVGKWRYLGRILRMGDHRFPKAT